MIELRRQFRLLGLVPGIGHARQDLSDDPGVRFWPVYSYIVAFLAAGRPVFIVRILHGSRSPEALREELRRTAGDPPAPP